MATEITNNDFLNLTFRTMLGSLRNDTKFDIYYTSIPVLINNELYFAQWKRTNDNNFTQQIFHYKDVVEECKKYIFSKILEGHNVNSIKFDFHGITYYVEFSLFDADDPKNFIINIYTFRPIENK